MSVRFFCIWGVRSEGQMEELVECGSLIVAESFAGLEASGLIQG